jgi:hypothetical protein
MPIPAEPHKRKLDELTTRDGKKFKVRVPGLEPRPENIVAEQRGGEEPPRDDPRPPHNPLHINP